MTLVFRFDDIDLPSAVKYLMASDPNLQVLGAAYIQHKCYSDNDAKKQVRQQKMEMGCKGMLETCLAWRLSLTPDGVT